MFLQTCDRPSDTLLKARPVITLTRNPFPPFWTPGKDIFAYMVGANAGFLLGVFVEVGTCRVKIVEQVYDDNRQLCLIDDAAIDLEIALF